MEYLVTAAEMHAYDTYTIEQIGIPALVLMERAALSVTERVLAALQKRPGRVLCVCGTGNNGGDGLCVARLLSDKGICVDVWLVGDKMKATKETQTQLAILQQYRLLVHDTMPKETYAVVVDALFGTGLSREVTGRYREAVAAINAMDAYRIAVDIPSGIDADTGAVWGEAIRADETVALAFYKRGHFLYPGASYAGSVYPADIGITQGSFRVKFPGMYTLHEPPGECMPGRRPDGNKGTFGKLLIVAGSEKMAGAALLAGESAYRMGAGMVKLVIPEAIREIVQERLPEALIQTYESHTGLTEAELELFASNMDWADAAVIGPGLSVCESAERLLESAIEKKELPLVIDADGINILAQNEKLYEKLKERRQKGKDKGPQDDKEALAGCNHVVLTPHMGELARLLKKETAEVVLHETQSAEEAALESKCIVVGKSARTHVCMTGSPVFLNTAGNAKMATAGSGDVLAGMIGALIVQTGNMPDGRKQAADSEDEGDMTAWRLKECAIAGVYLHACAGDAAAKKAGCAGIVASDIISGLSELC